MIAEIGGEQQAFSADTVIVSCGAINSAVLLLRSASDKHPHGLANRSGLVGRLLMKHLNAAMVGVTKHLNPTVFQKTLAINDFYWGTKDDPLPMGHVQLLGKAHSPTIVTGSTRVETDNVLDVATLLPLLKQPLGLNLEYSKGDGPVISPTVRGSADVDRLVEVDPDALGYVYDAVRATRRALNPKTPLIGFCGAPFTPGRGCHHDPSARRSHARHQAC